LGADHVGIAFAAPWLKIASAMPPGFARLVVGEAKLNEVFVVGPA
jgi:hypothetical protein